MNRSPVSFDAFITDGCGRCSLWRTSECKVHRWEHVLEALRMLLLEAGLQESIKWSMPCYTWNGKNVVMLAAFKPYVALAFFEGYRLEDSSELLVRPGENSHTIRQLRFTALADVRKLKKSIRTLLEEAKRISHVSKGASKSPSPAPPWPEEFTWACLSNPALRTAFMKLTPGRQRGYLLHFTSAKKSVTRESRIHACIPRILSGKGMDE